MRKEVREQVKYAKQLGFKFVGYAGSGHVLLSHPNCAEFAISSSPSSYSGFANARAEMRRIAGVGSLSAKQGRGRVKKVVVRRAPVVDVSPRAQSLRQYIRDCERQERSPAGLPHENVRKSLNSARQELAALDKAARDSSLL